MRMADFLRATYDLHFILNKVQFIINLFLLVLLSLNQKAHRVNQQQLRIGEMLVKYR